jgi:hypothetical protein
MLQFPALAQDDPVAALDCAVQQARKQLGQENDPEWWGNLGGREVHTLELIELLERRVGNPQHECVAELLYPRPCEAEEPHGLVVRH